MSWSTVKGVVVLLIVLSCITNVRANFVCGVLNDTKGVSSSWFEVSLFYPEAPAVHTACEVSPDGNKYCCDPLSIQGIAWKVGKPIDAIVSAQDIGFIAGPVETTISGEGYDVLPSMTLQKVFDIHAPTKNLFVNVSTIEFNISIDSRIRSVAYRVRSGNSTEVHTVCYNCTEATFLVSNLSRGVSTIELIANSTYGEFHVARNVSIVSSLRFSRRLVCPTCSGLFVTPLTNLSMEVTVITSDPIDATLEELVPHAWDVEKSISLIPYSDTHSIAKFPIRGNESVVRYELHSPSLFLPRLYYFQSRIEDFYGQKDSVVVQKYFPHWKYLSIPYFLSRVPKSTLKSILFFTLSKEHPALFSLEQCNCELVYFPAKPLGQVQFSFGYDSREFFPVITRTFDIGSSEGDTSFSSAQLTFSIPKKKWKKFSLADVSAEDSSHGTLLTLLKVGEDSDFLYYQLPINGVHHIRITQRYQLQWT